MRVCPSPSPFKSTVLSIVLTVVLTVGVLLKASPSYAQSSCRDVFAGSKHNEIDNNRRIARHLGDIDSEFAAELLGGIGFSLFRISEDRKHLIKREPKFSFQKERAMQQLRTRRKDVSPELNQLVDEMLRPQSLSNDTIMVSLPYSSWLSSSVVKSGHSNFAFKLTMRMEKLYQNTATWVYQRSGLEPLDPFTSGTMIDEAANYARNKKALSYFMLFDKAAWHEQLRFFEECWAEYLKDPSNTDLELKFLSPDTFLPESGVALAIPPMDSSLPVEIKRYFANDRSDPLELLSSASSGKDSFTLRNRLLLTTLKTIAPDRMLEIHSHTRIHTIAYRKLGFVVRRQTKNADYPNATVDLLEAKNSDVVAALTALLQRRSAFVQDRRDR